MNRQEHALALARQGFYIFPLRALSKEPRSKEEMNGLGWKDYMTTDEAVIRSWFAHTPDMNYGVSFGERGFIIDPDEDETKNKHGLAALADLEAENFEEPVSGFTFTVQSPRGGQHLYFMSPEPISNSKGSLPKDIDVRGRGGYVVGPGCALENGDYTVICDLPPMDAPAWLLARLERVGGRNEHQAEALFEYDQDFAVERARGWIKQQTSWPTEGQNGDDHTFRSICFIRDFGISAGMCFELMNEPAYEDGASWNERCAPPWNDDELQRKIENAYAYATNAPGQKGGLLDSMDDAGQEYATDETLPEAEPGRGLDAIFFPGSSLMDRAERREMIIPDWMMAHGIHALLAKKATGKTVQMLDLALRLACDMDWHDMPMDKGWAAVYACGEDDLGLQEQMAAWCKHNEIEPDDDRFIVMAAAPNVMDAQEVEKWTRFILSKLKGRRAVFFVDTWQRATSHASQNDDAEMQTAFAHVEAMAKSFRGPAVAAFHPPKANENTTMGSSTIENSTVAIWHLSREPQYRLMTVTRIKGRGEGSYQRFQYEVIKLGEVDKFGDERTGVIAKHLSGSKAPNYDVMASLTNGARYQYAALLNDLYMTAEREEADFPEKRDSQFNLTNSAQRIEVYARQNPNDHRLKALRQLGDTAFVKFETMRKHLSTLFLDDRTPVELEDGTNVACVKGRGRSEKFIFRGAGSDNI